MYYELAPGPIDFCLQNHALLFGGNKICTKIDLLLKVLLNLKLQLYVAYHVSLLWSPRILNITASHKVKEEDYHLCGAVM